MRTVCSYVCKFTVRRNAKIIGGITMFYREPKYYSEFHCTGPECTNNCCYGWRIDWSKEEIDKVKNAEKISPELKTMVENSFVEMESAPKKNIVKFNEKNICPFQLENGLCKIQRELGAEYLSLTCTVYPRKSVATRDYIYRNVNMSCPEVSKILSNNEDAMRLLNVIAEPQNLILNAQDTEEELKETPELKYRSELLEFFYNLIADKSLSVENAIILGALAAQALTKLVKEKKADDIPDALIQIKRQLHNDAQIQKIDEIKPNYTVKFGIIDDLCINVCNFTMSKVLRDETGTPNLDYYALGEGNLNEMFSERQFWFRNITLNTLLEMSLPFYMKDRTIFENYAYFATVIGCYKLNAVAAAAVRNEVNIQTQGQTFHFVGDQKVFGVISLISRGLLQSNVEPKAVLRRLLDFSRLTPALAALLVK